LELTFTATLTVAFLFWSNIDFNLWILALLLLSSFAFSSECAALHHEAVVVVWAVCLRASPAFVQLMLYVNGHIAGMAS
jgi:hypothetical protein